MNQEIKERWVAKLRSGEIKQATGKLRRKFDDGSEGMCCLGVLCELAVEAGVLPAPELRSGFEVEEEFYAYARQDVPVETQVLPLEVQVWAEVSSENPDITARIAPDGAEVSCLASLNDRGGSFELIANVIEQEL